MREAVHCIGRAQASADAVWDAVSDFGVAWHPYIAWDKVEVGAGAQIIRRFQAEGDNTVMVERLRYISYSDREMWYQMLEGIADVDRYEARLQVVPEGAGAGLSWQADIDAAAGRASEIAKGTVAVFEAGIAALNDPLARKGKAVKQVKPAGMSHLMLGKGPRLGLSVAPEGLRTAKTICILLHGIGGNRDNWDTQLRALGHVMPMVSLDLRGYGDSTLGAGPSDIDAYADDIAAVMAHFRAKRVVLCGLSYGAWIAASVALRAPEKVAGLVLCGGCTGMSEAPPEKREAFRSSRQVPLDAGHTPADFADAVVDVIAGPEAGAQVRGALHASMSAIPAATYRDALTCFCTPRETLDFAAATFPVLLMTGEYDALAPPEEIRAVSHRWAQAGAPFVNFEEITGAGHVCNLEKPDVVNAHLLRFFRLLGVAAKPSPKVAKKSEKRARIIAAALREFSKNGFSGASMQAIAKRAEVSKPTLYQYIGQKEDIFHAVLDAGRAQLLAPFQQASTAYFVQVLWDFAWVYSRYVLHPDNLSIARLIIGEAERVPEVARQFHAAGPAKVQTGIAEYLSQQAEAGRLRIDDPDLAAEHLWSLILSGPRNHALHFPDNMPGDKTLRASISKGLEVFLRAYATDPAEQLGLLVEVSDQVHS